MHGEVMPYNRLDTEDPDVFSDGGEDDKDGWVCPRVWPQIPIPLCRKRPAPYIGLKPSYHILYWP